MPLNPRALTPTASINRVIITLNEEDDSPRAAYEILGAHALYALISHFANTLQLPRPLPDKPTPEIMQVFQSRFHGDDADARKSADKVREMFMFNVFMLIMVLRRGSELDRDLREEWDDSYWAYWRRVPRIVLGGGLLSDNIGVHLSDYIARMMKMHRNAAPVKIVHDPYGSYLPLIGAARCAPHDTQHMAVLDFGGTSVKAGVAHYKNGSLTSIGEKVAYPSPLDESYSPIEQDDTQKRALLQSMADRIAQTIMQSPFAASISHVVASVAAYIDPNGHPYPNSIGGYAGLQAIVPNVQQALTDAVNEKIGRAITLRLVHDGTAAATVYPGAAVLVFGTAIGFGAHPEVDDPRPLAADFTI